MKEFKFIALICSIFFLSCNEEEKSISRAFYYWKTTYNISESESALLKKNKIETLYVRFFDVDWNTKFHDVLPVQEIQFLSAIDTSVQYIPVVFITNDAIDKVPDQHMNLLAKKIVKQISVIAERQHLLFKEVQIDCDWTEKTREKYFALLSRMKEMYVNNNVQLSATIRLHQVKYYKKTGIPPVHLGMLMFYNMGKINSDAASNSIYNKEDAAKYIESLTNYPLSLNVALPVFSWGIHIRNHKILELVNDVNHSELSQSKYFTKKTAQEYEALSSHYYHGKYYKKGDVVKIEEVDPALCLQAAEQIAPKLKNENRKVVLFDLDSINTKSYHEKEFQKIFSCFN